MVKEINYLTAAAPVRVVLHDLMEPDVYSGAESYPTIELVYLHGCKELHAFAESESSTQITIGGKLCRVALNQKIKFISPNPKDPSGSLQRRACCI